MGGCCANPVDVILEAKRQIEAAAFAPLNMEEGVVVRMRFTGPQVGNLSYGGPGRAPSGRAYTGGLNSVGLYQDVLEEDVNYMLRLGVWELVQTPTPVIQAPSTEAPVVTLDIPTDVKRKPGRAKKDLAAAQDEKAEA